jgi:hypothetical protein
MSPPGLKLDRKRLQYHAAAVHQTSSNPNARLMLRKCGMVSCVRELYGIGSSGFFPACNCMSTADNNAAVPA